MTSFTIPRYGSASLSDVMPSVLAALEVGGSDRLPIEPAQRMVVLLVDGMGLVDLQAHAEVAPYLSSMACTELTAGFPSTTVTSLASLSTGVPAGQHGLTGYTTYVEEIGAPVNWLTWKPAGGGDDLRDRLVPEVVQPEPTAWQRAADAGVSVAVVSAHSYNGTGLTRAVFRGGGFTGTVTSGDAVALAADMSDRGHRSLVYCYISELDLIGHVRGPGSDAWLAQLALVDTYVSQLAARLPAGTTLLVTADHGMVTMSASTSVDADEDGSPLMAGVAALAGEARMRYVHARPGAAGDVLDTWRTVLGDRAWVMTGDEAVGAGLFGPVVTPVARARIGDVLAISRGPLGVVRRRRESTAASLLGHHGALTDAELLVPLLSARL